MARRQPSRLAAAGLLALAIALAPGAAGEDALAANAGDRRAGQLPGPAAGVKAKLRAYGARCTGIGRRAQARVKGSDFARCLDAMARLGSGRTSSPPKACRALSARPAKGRGRSPRARCMSAGATVVRDRRRARGAPGGGVTAPNPSGAGDDVSIEDDSGAPSAPDDAAPDGGAGRPEPDDGSDPEVPIEDPGADPA